MEIWELGDLNSFNLPSLSNSLPDVCVCVCVCFPAGVGGEKERERERLFYGLARSGVYNSAHIPLARAESYGPM